MFVNAFDPIVKVAVFKQWYRRFQKVHRNSLREPLSKHIGQLEYYKDIINYK